MECQPAQGCCCLSLRRCRRCVVQRLSACSSRGRTHYPVLGCGRHAGHWPGRSAWDLQFCCMPGAVAARESLVAALSVNLRAVKERQQAGGSELSLGNTRRRAWSVLRVRLVMLCWLVDRAVRCIAIAIILQCGIIQKPCMREVVESLAALACITFAASTASGT
jgi:hypothetical protein